MLTDMAVAPFTLAGKAKLMRAHTLNMLTSFRFFYYVAAARTKLMPGRQNNLLFRSAILALF